MLPTSDLLTAALPSRYAAAPRFDPFGATTYGGTMPASQVVDMHRKVVRQVEEANPEVNDRMRVEMALPARLMWPWTQACNQPWSGPRDSSLMEEMARNFKVEMAACLVGLNKGNYRGEGNDWIKVYNRIVKVSESVLFPIQACPVNVRPSNLTGFMACSFVWQTLIESGKMELQERSLFHRTWESFADVVSSKHDLETLVKARKAALKRTDVMLKTLNDQGYYT